MSQDNEMVALLLEKLENGEKISGNELIMAGISKKELTELRDINKGLKIREEIENTQNNDEEKNKQTKEKNMERAKEDKMISSKEEKNERRRVSFDIRKDLHRRLKMLSATEDKNIYILIEEAVEKYLNELDKN